MNYAEIFVCILIYTGLIVIDVVRNDNSAYRLARILLALCVCTMWLLCPPFKRYSDGLHRDIANVIQIVSVMLMLTTAVMRRGLVGGRIRHGD